jgi:hypothetical protein
VKPAQNHRPGQAMGRRGPHQRIRLVSAHGRNHADRGLTRGPRAAGRTRTNPPRSKRSEPSATAQ